jgi:hypothetical protein
LNRDIVGAILTVKESTFTDGTVVEPPDADADADELELELELDELEQPAAANARTAATATQLSLGKRRNLPSPCERESWPPSLLLPSAIPIPFR